MRNGAQAAPRSRWRQPPWILATPLSRSIPTASACVFSRPPGAGRTEPASLRSLANVRAESRHGLLEPVVIERRGDNIRSDQIDRGSLEAKDLRLIVVPFQEVGDVRTMGI